MTGYSNTLIKCYEVYYRRTYLFAKSYVHDQWIAEDIASEAFAKLWEVMEKNKIRHPVTFLFAIVKNKSIDYLRHECIRQEAYSRISETSIKDLLMQTSNLKDCEPENLYSEDIMNIVNETLKILPDRTREIFLMHRFQDLPKDEIAEKLNLTTKGIEYHIAKTLKVLRISLKDYLPVLYLFFLHKY